MKRHVALLMALYLTAGCSRTREAAEILNSGAHYLVLGEMALKIPNDLQSGACRHKIGESTLSYTGSTGVMNASVDLSDDSKLTCTLKVTYTISPEGTSLLGAGNIFSCDSFNCSIGSQIIECEALKKAMHDYTCSTTSEF